MPIRPAASAAPTNGDSGSERWETSHRQRGERRTGRGSWRTRAMTRWTAIGSTATARLASRAIQSTYGSDSVIPNSLPPLAQLIARALDPHLERGDARARECCHLLVAQLLDILEEKRLTQQRVQLV